MLLSFAVDAQLNAALAEASLHIVSLQPSDSQNNLMRR